MDNYKIDKDNITFYIDTNIYNDAVIKKAIYNFIEDRKVILNKIDEKTVVVVSKKSNDDIENFVKNFYSELLNESLRFEVMKETKNIRELILGRALYSTCIDTEENEERTEINNRYNIDDIAKNWFEE